MKDNLRNIVLEDETGRKSEFEVVSKFDIEDREYVVVIPKDNNNLQQAIALRIDKDANGEDILVTVEDEEEFSSVVKTYEMLFESDIQD